MRTVRTQRPYLHSRSVAVHSYVEPVSKGMRTEYDQEGHAQQMQQFVIDVLNTTNAMADLQ